MSVRAKFRCSTVSAPRPATLFEDGGTRQVEAVDISLTPVTTGSEENKEFYTNTPAGAVTLMTVNLAAAEQFVIGKEYYVDFTPVDVS